MPQTLICPCCRARIQLNLAPVDTIPTNAYKRGTILTLKDKETLGRIASVVCNYFGVTRDQFTGASRKREIALVRHYYSWLATSLTEINVAKIALYCGGRDRTTIYNAITQVNNLMETGHADGQHGEPLIRLYREQEQAQPLKIAV